MRQILLAKKSMCNKEGGRQTIRLEERGATMQCPRCGGLMIVERFQDLLDETGRINFYALRCLLCSETLDPTILMNRTAGESSLVH